MRGPVLPHDCVLIYQEPFSYPVCKVCRTVFERAPAAASDGVTVTPLYDLARLLLDLHQQIGSIPREKMHGYLVNLRKSPESGDAFAWLAAEHGFDLEAPTLG